MTQRNQLIKDNFGLVRMIAHYYARCYPSFYDDLEQIGALGLIKAADKFQPELGYKFSSFAIPWIRGEVQHFFAASSHYPIKIPRSLLKKGVKPYVTSLDWFIKFDNQAVALEDFVPDTRQVNAATDKEFITAIKAEIQSLDNRTKKVLELHYLKNQTMREIAKTIGVSEMTVCRLNRKGLSLIRERLGVAA